MSELLNGVYKAYSNWKNTRKGSGQFSQVMGNKTFYSDGLIKYDELLWWLVTVTIENSQTIAPH